MSRGARTGGMIPTGRASTPCRRRHAWAVQRLLDAGAALVGKTVTDEVSMGILGENPFDGTALRDPRAPGRVPGGSSSASAVAVARRGDGHRARHRYRRLGPGAGELLRALRQPGRRMAGSTSPA